MNNLILRNKYLKRIEPFMGKNLIKVFTGQRRVGKSYLLFQVMEEIRKKDSGATILYINKEDLGFAFLRNAEGLNRYVKQNKPDKGKTYVFIDEVQDIENFEVALRSLLLDQSIDLYCTGSNAHMLSGDIAGHLSGRFIEIPVYSLTYQEFMHFHQLEDSEEVLQKYLKFGGLPYLIHLPLEDHIVFEYLKNVYSTILFRDIINRFSVRNTLFLEQLILFLASNTGSIFSAKKISDFLKSQKINIAPNQVQLYIQHLASAFLVHQVGRYDITGKRLFEIGEKYYFENLGIRNALWGYRPEDRGKILENAICNHLLAEDYKVKVGVIADGEIDFIAEKNNEKMYIQAALTLNEQKTIRREFGNLLKIKDNYPKLLVTMDQFTGNTYEGIQVTDLRTFLTGKQVFR